MATEQELTKQILTTVDDAIANFNGSIPALQKQMLDDITLLVKDLDITDSGTIKNSVSNLRVIGKIKVKLENIILSDGYIKQVEEFTTAFKEVADLQNKYFNAIEKTFTPTKLLDEIQKQSIGATIESLTQAGISANVTEYIQEILRTNITTGGSYNSLLSQLRNAMLSNSTGLGALERYTQQITTDSLNQYSRQYMAAVSDDLGLEWFMYVGSNLTTTREFCDKLTKKKYYHKSELPEILKGNIDGTQVKINPKTKLWYGAIPGTDVNNFKVNSGGYQCGHHPFPVAAAAVPADLRMKFNP